jgi:hypothetical protein
VTFDCFSNLLVRVEYEWKSTFEVFSVCRRCQRSTVLLLALVDIEHRAAVQQPEFWKRDISLNRFFKVLGHVSLKDKDASPPPENLPAGVEAAYAEGATCVAVGCHNAAAAMFRLALDLATSPLLPNESEPEPSWKVRRDLGLRIQWLFANGKLPGDLKDLSDCVREDGNDGAHRGNVEKVDAEDLRDFSFELLDRLYSEPGRLLAAKARREARRSAARGEGVRLVKTTTPGNKGR